MGFFDPSGPEILGLYKMLEVPQREKIDQRTSCIKDSILDDGSLSIRVYVTAPHNDYERVML